METFYFTKVTQDYWTAKNQLQKEAKKLMKSFERKIVLSTEKADFMKGITAAFSDLNQKYPRCKPLWLDRWTPEKDPMIHISGVTGLVFYKCAD